MVRSFTCVAVMLSALLRPISAQDRHPVAATKAAKAPIDGDQIYYYNGNSRVELVLATDELNVELEASALPVEAELKSSSGKVVLAESHGANGAKVKLTGIRSKAELENEAKKLKQNPKVKAVHAVAYRRGASAKDENSRQAIKNQFSLKLSPGQSIDTLSARHGLKIVEKVSFSPDTYIVEVVGGGLLSAVDAANKLKEQEKVEFATPLIERQMTRKTLPNDPFISQQWHLKNMGGNAVTPAIAGNDINIESVWPAYTGAGVNIGVTDDGLQTDHPDLAANCRMDIDIDINYNDLDPSPALTDPGPGGSNHSYYLDAHGTSAAGVAGAKGNNALGVTGAAYNSGLAGIRLISTGSTDLQESQAMLHRMADANVADIISINTNSWGPPDDGATLDDAGPFPLVKAALLNGVTQGRGGRGTIYTWACGNGGTADNANYDGYANSRYTIAVAASAANGTQSSYSEQGACVLVNAPSSYGTGGIVTVDRTGTNSFNVYYPNQNGYNTGDYTCNTSSCGFGGTSSACPLVAGVVALVLEANPNLTWRDVQHVLAESAAKNSPTDSGWVTNGAGKSFNHKFGFGRVDAQAAINKALSWQNVPAEMVPLTASSAQSQAIPDNDATGISQTVTISDAPAGTKLEHVEFSVNATHPFRGHLEFFLTSPSGTVSRVSQRSSDSNDNYNDWTFMTVANWGENPNGTWTLRVADRVESEIGTLNSWSLTARGFVLTTSAGDWQLYN